MVKTTQLLTFAVCLLIPIELMANGIEPDFEFYSATFANNEIILDGDLSEWGDIAVIENPTFLPQAGGARVTFEEHGGGNWTGLDDHSANVQITWDEENVYLGLVVTDDYHENSANSGWNGDSAQVHIANDARDTQVALYNFALGGIEGALGDVVIHEESGPGGTNAVVTRNSTTTTYEIQFSQAALGLDVLFVDLEFGLGVAINDGDDGAGQDGQKGWSGLGPDVVVFGKEPAETALITLAPEANAEPFTLNGNGETYFQDFDEMGTGRRVPKGWSGEDTDGSSRSTDSLGLVDGPLEGAVESAAGVVNVGGNAERFSTPADGRVGTWQDDLDGSGALDAADVVADAATDRALGNGRVNSDDTGSLSFEIEISDRPVRALTFGWDLEIWGGDPEAAFRGTEGGGYIADLSVGGNSYFSQTVSLVPGDLFDTSFDSSPGASHDPTLINGNEHAVRGNSSGIVEVTAADGAVGNLVQLSFNADHGGDDGGWISAVDNVLVRALAAGDAQADGDVDPADLIQLLAGGAFGQGNIDATWGQGDFDNDGDFDGTDILAVVQGLAGEFPKTYAHDPSNGVPDVLINPATGNITLDTNGTTIGSIVMDSAAGIFNGPNSPSWDAPGDFAADIDTQISMPISFTNPGYTGVDDLGDGIIGDLAPGFDILADLTIKYLDPNGDLLDAEAHVVPEPSSIVLATIGILGMLGCIRRRRRLN